MVPFVYLASVCRSLQCLISTLTQAGGGGLLLRFACSVVLRGGRGAADKCHWRVWGALAVFRPLWACPGSQRVCYTAQAPGCSIGSKPWVACCSSFRVLHKSPDSVRPSSSGSQELDERTLPGCGAPYPLRGSSLSFCALWSGAPYVCSGELVSSHDPPGNCQPSRISGSLWLETGSSFPVW